MSAPQATGGRRSAEPRPGGYREVVTDAKLRMVELPDGTRVALVTLDNGLDHTRPVTFGPAGLARLDAALDAAEASDADAVAVTGKPFGFAAGADVTGMATVTDRTTVLELCRTAHRVFGRLGTGAKPTFAFVNGLALGGGLELALHCTYRTISSNAGAVGLPEVMLGLVPGWGGCYLLPNLVGPAAAVTVAVDNPLSQNRTLGGPRAYELGLADVLLEPADFLERSLAWAADVLAGRVVVQRPEVDRGPAWTATLTAARAALDARLHGAAAAPYRALDLLELARTADRDAAFAAEDEASADLVCGDQLRAGLYAFDLVQHRARRPAGAPPAELARPVGAVGVVGAGLMATQLALLFVRRLAVPVVLTDVDPDRLARGVAWVHDQLADAHGRGRLDADRLARLTGLVTGAPSVAAFADADLVIEAVFEQLAVKREVFAAVEAAVGPRCVLATNTSSLSVAAMADGLAHPERVVGMHFFNPVAVMPLLEVVRTAHTDDASLATALAVGRTLRKSCVLVADAPAFVVNRVLARLMTEVQRAVDDGTPVEVADRAFDPLGLPMPPFVLLGLVGPAIALHTAETLQAAFGERFAASANLRRLVEAGRPGVYRWEDGVPRLDPAAADLLRVGQRPWSAEQVRERALAAVADEVARLLAEGVVGDPRDVDLCLLLGAGWPFHLGGVTPYLDRTGVAEQVTGRRFLPAGVASLPAGAG